MVIKGHKVIANVSNGGAELPAGLTTKRILTENTDFTFSITQRQQAGLAQVVVGITFNQPVDDLDEFSLRLTNPNWMGQHTLSVDTTFSKLRNVATAVFDIDTRAWLQLTDNPVQRLLMAGGRVRAEWTGDEILMISEHNPATLATNDGDQIGAAISAFLSGCVLERLTKTEVQG